MEQGGALIPSLFTLCRIAYSVMSICARIVIEFIELIVLRKIETIWQPGTQEA